MNIDSTIIRFDAWLKAITATPCGPVAPEHHLSIEDKERVVALWRVNHTGEVCAQALYYGQALGATSEKVQHHLKETGKAEQSHIEATSVRLRALGGHPSLLNPLWSVGSLMIGRAVATCGDKISLGFVQETEKQVVEHLQEHEKQIPLSDRTSLHLVRSMQKDEAEHGEAAGVAGGVPLPFWARRLMRASANIMKSTARYI